MIAPLLSVGLVGFTTLSSNAVFTPSNWFDISSNTATTDVIDKLNSQAKTMSTTGFGNSSASNTVSNLTEKNLLNSSFKNIMQN